MLDTISETIKLKFYFQYEVNLHILSSIFNFCDLLSRRNWFLTIFFFFLQFSRYLQKIFTIPVLNFIYTYILLYCMASKIYNGWNDQKASTWISNVSIYTDLWK